MTKQKTGHTPGPWRVEETVGAPMVVAGERGSVKERRTSTYREIAQVRYYFGSEDVSLAEANAPLIAAAPLMLEELRKLEWLWITIDEAGNSHISCLSCLAFKKRHPNHFKNCTLAAAIKAATEV